MAPNRRVAILSGQLLAAAPTAAIEFTGVNHIARGTTDVTKLTEFYKNILDFRVVQRPMNGRGGSWMRNGNMMIHVTFIPDNQRQNLQEGDKPTTWQLEQLQQREAEVSKIQDLRPGLFMGGNASHLAFDLPTKEAVEAVLEKLKKHNVKHYVTDHVKIAKGDNKDGMGQGMPGGNAAAMQQQGSKDMVSLGIEMQLLFYDPDGNAIEVSNYGLNNFPPDDPEEKTVNRKVMGAE